MKNRPDLCIVWDFDGVINLSSRDGKIVWAESFEQDLEKQKASIERTCFNGTSKPCV